MRSLKFSIPLIILLALCLAPAWAHEGREVGEALIEFGWRVEPAYTTLLNGPEITVENHASEEGIAGLEDTLTLTVTFGPKSKVLKLHPVEGEIGHYTADLIPTRPGDYIFQLTGTIDGVAVDETFNSADGEFSPVEPIEDIQFP